MKNWKTTLFGLLAGAPMIAAAFHIPDFGHIGAVSGLQAISGVGSLLLGFFAKDRNVTGAGPTAVAQ